METVTLQKEIQVEQPIEITRKPAFWENKLLLAGVVAGLYLIMVAFNFMTILHGDDYVYSFSFVNGERIESVLDIFPSMARHAETMNGRLVAHFFAQLFLMMPKFIFNFVNAGIFMMELWLIYKMANHQKPRNAILFFFIACMVWYFTPVFGQTNLWLDGSCNYLWGVAFMMLAFYPYYRLYVDGTYRSKAVYLLPLFSFFVGAYSENHSLGAIVGIICFVILIKFFNKQSLPLWAILSPIIAIVGYVWMLFMPGNFVRLEFYTDIPSFPLRLFRSLDMMMNYLGIPFFAFLILATIAVYAKCHTRRIVASCVFVFVSLTANFAMAASPIYGERSMLGSAICLITGCVILLTDLLATKYDLLVRVAMVITVFLATIQFVKGGYDIAVVYRAAKVRESYILSETAKGHKEVTVGLLRPKTKYTSLYKLMDLNTENPYGWPNRYMAKYYGLEVIFPEEEKP